MIKYILFLIFLVALFIYKKLKYKLSQRLSNQYHSDKIKNIKLLTWNIQILPHFTKSLEKLEEIIQNYDVIILQEFYTNLWIDKKSWLEKFCKKYKYNIVIHNKISFKRLKFLDSGLVTLSKFKIIESNNHYFKDSCNIDSFCNKGFLYTKIKIGEKYINLYNLHAQAFYDTNLKYNIEISIKQIKQIKKEINLNNKFIIIGGDFNLNSKYINPIFSNLKPNIPNKNTIFVKFENDKEIDTISSEEQGYKGFTYDYFYSKNIDIKNIKANDENFSDHKYVTANFDLN